MNNDGTFDFMIVDAGNTRIKLGLFFQDKLIKHLSLATAEFSSWPTFIAPYASLPNFVSSVLNENQTNLILAQLKTPTLLSSSDIIFQHTYTTFDTLGVDRKANVVYMLAQHKYPCLTIDIGTCIKFDYIDAAGIYKGGSIAPGIEMRFKALNYYTGRLPIVTYQKEVALIGDSTQNSILSGVINGITHEINGTIMRYHALDSKITIFVTGGDAEKIDIQKENCIFAQFLTLNGLYLIHKINA
jgi:type III pantothenate kinase